MVAGTLNVLEPSFSFTASNLTSSVFNNIRCRLSLVPGSPVTINDDGSIANGGINFATGDVNTTNNTIAATGIAGKLNSTSIVRVYGSDLPVPLDSRAVYYPSTDYDNSNNISLASTPGGTTIDLTDVGSGSDMYLSAWTELDIDLVTSGSYTVNLSTAASTAGVSLTNGSILVFQAIHHDVAGTGGSANISAYLEESFQYNLANITSLSSLTLANNEMQLLRELGLDGSQVTGYSLDTSAPSKVQIDISKDSISTKELLAFYLYTQWTETGMRFARGNIEVENLNSIGLRGELTFDAATRSVMSGPFIYRLDGNNIVAPESQQISFNWQNTRAAIVETEVAVDLPSDVLQAIQSILHLTSQIPNISGGSGGGATAAATADAVLRELVADHSAVSGSLAEAISNLPTTTEFEARTLPSASYLTSTNYDAIATAVWSATTRELTNITSAQITAIATGVETAIINEGDGQQVIDAILQVFNTNLDLPALELTAIAQAVRSELTAELGLIDASISSRLATSGYTNPLDATGTETAVTNALTSQGYTTARSVFLDKLNVTGVLAHSDNASLFQASGFSTHSAADIRTELSTELGRIDVNLSSRLSSTDYTNPLDSSATQSAVTTALTSQGYTLGRAAFLDNLNVAGTLANTSNASLFQASGFSTHSAVDVWNAGTRTLTAIDKTGYSLTQSFPSNFSLLSIDGNGNISLPTLQNTQLDELYRIRGLDNVNTKTVNRSGNVVVESIGDITITHTVDTNTENTSSIRS